MARLLHNHAATRQALADIVVGIASEFERDAMREEGTKALPGNAGEGDLNGVFGQACMTIFLGHLTRKHRADGAVEALDLAFDADSLAFFECRCGGSNQVAVKRLVEAMVLSFGLVQRQSRPWYRRHAAGATGPRHCAFQ